MKRLVAIVLAVIMLVTATACSMQVSSKASGDAEAKPAEPVWLYPAYIIDNGSQKWGYIDNTGKYAIQPQFEAAQDFQDNGLAVVADKELYGIIQKNGQLLVEPKYESIGDYSEGLAVAHNKNGTYDILDEQGQIVFTSTDYLWRFKNGMSVVTKDAGNYQYTYGYIDKTGNMVIQPVFKHACDFENDRALVQLDENKYAIIDSKGNTIKELDYQQIDTPSEGVMAFTDSKNMHGYLTMDGNVLAEAKFSSAGMFENGYAIVAVNKPDNEPGMLYGLLDKNGEYAIKPEYTSMSSIGAGYYSVSKEGLPYADLYNKKAIVNAKGEILTGFDYYDIGSFENGIVSVSDGSSTFFIDGDGKRIKELPSVEGSGTLKVRGDVVAGTIDNEIIYLDKSGKLVWQPDKTVKLADGSEILQEKYKPDRCMLIRYPQLANMKDEKLQDKLNKKLKQLFVGDNPKSKIEDGNYINDITVDYSASQNKDLLIVEKDGYDYPLGAAHGMPSKTFYHINLKNGDFYELKDLFKKDSKYVERLSEIIGKKIGEESKKEDGMYFENQYKGIRADQDFTVTDKALQIYFYPYEIAAYAAGFPSFDIPYSDIADIIDDQGEFWSLFDKTVASNSLDAGTVQDDKALIAEAVKGYESGIIDAINSNEFFKVKAFLYPDSSLYKDQEALVESLSRKGIKEQLNGYQIMDLKKESDGSYKVYVDEDITLKCAGTPDYSGKYSWIYTARYSDESKAYLLSDIERWNK